MVDTLEVQQARRRERITRALGRAPDHTIASPRAFGYRARVSLRPDANGKLGYNPPRSNAVLPIDACPIARPEIDALLSMMPPVFSGLSGVELRSDGASVVISAFTRRRHGRNRKARRASGVSTAALADLIALPGLAGVVLDGRVLAGDGRTTLTVAGVTHHLRPETFYQVNLDINALLVDTVNAQVRDAAPARVLDLYAGAGNLSLPLAGEIPLTLIEQSPSAIADATDTVRRLGVSDVDVRRGDAGAFQAGDAFFDVVILDPPRAGAPGVIAQLVVTRPRRIVYVSCNPTSLARDLRPAQAAGYTIARLDFFDMFPHTHHAEVLCVLDRPG